MIACSTRFGRDMLRGGLLAGMPRFLSLHLIPPSLPRPGARRRTSRPRSARASPRRPPGTCAPARASWSVPSVGRSRPHPSAFHRRLLPLVAFACTAHFDRWASPRLSVCQSAGAYPAAAVESAGPQQNPARSSAAAPTRAAWCLAQFAPPGSGANIHDHT